MIRPFKVESRREQGWVPLPLCSMFSLQDHNPDARILLDRVEDPRATGEAIRKYNSDTFWVRTREVSVQKERTFVKETEISLERGYLIRVCKYESYEGLTAYFRYAHDKPRTCDILIILITTWL